MPARVCGWLALAHSTGGMSGAELARQCETRSERTSTLLHICIDEPNRRILTPCSVVQTAVQCLPGRRWRHRRHLHIFASAFETAICPGHKVNLLAGNIKSSAWMHAYTQALTQAGNVRRQFATHHPGPRRYATQPEVYASETQFHEQTLILNEDRRLKSRNKTITSCNINFLLAENM